MVSPLNTAPNLSPVSAELGTLRPELATLAKTFREAGYATFGTGKWHNDRRSFAEGFSGGGNIFFGGMSNHLEVPLYDFDPSGEYPVDRKRIGDGFSTELFSQAAIDFLDGYDAEAPFFLYLAFTSPHDPRMAPVPYDRMYPPESIPLPDNFLPEYPFDNGEMRIRDEKLAPFPRTPKIVREHIADYYGMITHQDAHMEDVLRALDRSGRADDTIVVYTADHGLAVGQHGLLGKQNLYDHSVRVPCILRGPGIPSGRSVDSLVYSYDLFPTLCDLAGVAIPHTVESESLAPLLWGKRSAVRGSAYAAYRHIHRMVRSGDWKLICYRAEENGSGVDRIQLFNLKDDPWETCDLSDDPHRAGQISQRFLLNGYK